MKKLLLSISFILNIILVGALVYMGGNVLNKNLQQGENNQKIHRIAVLQPAIHPSMDEITKGFTETIERSLPIGSCEFTLFNANNNSMLMRAQAEEIVLQQFDIFMTIGSKASQLAKEVAQKKGSQIPIIYTAVSDVVEKGLVESLACSGNQVTGVVEAVNPEEQVALLCIVRPGINHVLLVYNPSQVGLVQEGDLFEAMFSSKNITFSRAEVFQSNEVYQKVAGMLSGVEAVLVLKDHTVVTSLESLAKLCSSRNITLMTCDLDSPARGAALGFGIFEREFGVLGAKTAVKILQDNKAPRDIPSVVARGSTLRINPEACATQGVSFSDDMIKLLRVASVL